MKEIKQRLQEALAAIEYYDNTNTFLSPLSESDTVCQELIDKSRNQAETEITNLTKYLYELGK